MLIRMYVDEVGNTGIGTSEDPNNRYLSLTGIRFALDYMDSSVQPDLEALKRRHFSTHVDEPIVLHRKELVNRDRPFEALRVPEREAAFNDDLCDFLTRTGYNVITTAIDKAAHLEKYGQWRNHPYHYCMEVLVERFVMSLNRGGDRGDVYGESRGAKEDRELKQAFRDIYRRGTKMVDVADIRRALVDGEIKLKRKTDNVAGLQIADLIAHPSYKAMLAQRCGTATQSPFGARIVGILEATKLDRNSRGEFTGWGRKWLP